MKKIIVFAGLLLFSGSIIFMTGCKKDEDSIAPVISLSGSATMYIQKDHVFSDPGATATDDLDGTVNVTSSGSVNTATVGTYTITYTAKDNAKNTDTKTRVIYVVDFAGTYTNSENCDQSGTNSGSSTISASSTTNNRILVGNFALASVTVNGDVSGTTITIPSQTFGSETYSGSGTISGTTAIVLNINYTQTNTSGTNTCSATYTKQ